MNEQVKIEEEVLRVSNNLLKEWQDKFTKISVTIDELSIYRNNSESEYFSEIEFNFWKENTLITCFSLIIFMENNLSIDLNNLENIINEEIMICYQECTTPS